MTKSPLVLGSSLDVRVSRLNSHPLLLGARGFKLLQHGCRPVETEDEQISESELEVSVPMWIQELGNGHLAGQVLLWLSIFAALLKGSKDELARACPSSFSFDAFLERMGLKGGEGSDVRKTMSLPSYGHSFCLRRLLATHSP